MNKPVPISKLKFLIKGYNIWSLIGFLVLTGISCCLIYALPYITKKWFDDGLVKRNWDIIFVFLLAQLGTIILKILNDFLRNIIVYHLSLRVSKLSIAAFFEKILDLKIEYFQKRTASEIVQLGGDLYRLESLLYNILINGFVTVLITIVFSILLTIINPLIALFFFGGSIIAIVYVFLFSSKRRILEIEKINNSISSFNSLHQYLSGIKEIILNGAEREVREDFSKTQNLLAEVKRRSVFIEQIQYGGFVVINELKNFFITFYLVIAAFNQTLSIGEMLGALFLLSQLNASISQSIGIINHIQDLKLLKIRITDLHAEEERKNQGQLIPPPDICRIKVKNVFFKYESKKNWTLENINIIFEPGTYTWLVGSSGSGKSTLIKLLLQLYKFQGQILLNDTPLDQIDFKKLNENIGSVLQNGFLFDNSIGYNIALSESYQEQDVKWALQMVGILDFVASLPEGINENIGTKGIGLSEGQRQRILIARCLYKRPKYVLLDEATSSLDAPNEFKFYENTRLNLTNSTFICVTHRLNLIKSLDKVVVFENGSVVETGTQYELMKKKGKFYDFYHNQEARN